MCLHRPWHTQQAVVSAIMTVQHALQQHAARAAWPPNTSPASLPFRALCLPLSTLPAGHARPTPHPQSPLQRQNKQMACLGLSNADACGSFPNSYGQWYSMYRLTQRTCIPANNGGWGLAMGAAWGWATGGQVGGLCVLERQGATAQHIREVRRTLQAAP